MGLVLGSSVLIDAKQLVGDNYVAIIKLLKISPDRKKPDGYKLNCVLLNISLGKPVLILDNHDPFGYHLHSNPASNHDDREEIIVEDPFEAINIFFQKVKEITG